jgi:hypothetical protein
MSDNQTVPDSSVMEEEQATVDASESPNSSPGRTTESNRNSNSHVATTAPFNPMSRKRKVPGALQSDLTVRPFIYSAGLDEVRLYVI